MENQTQKKAKHTATPWKAVAGLNRWNITTTDKPRTYNICSINTERMEQEANAAFIVTACNAHEDFLLLLQKIARSACLDQRLDDRCICFSCEAKDAIHKAEGQ